MLNLTVVPTFIETKIEVMSLEGVRFISNDLDHQHVASLWSWSYKDSDIFGNHIIKYFYLKKPRFFAFWCLITLQNT